MNKISALIIVTLLFSNLYTIYLYEKKFLVQNERIIDGIKLKRYTFTELKNLIRNSPNYRGDSIVLLNNGRLKSLNPKLNQLINKTYSDKAMFSYLEDISKNELLPIQLVLYNSVSEQLSTDSISR